MVELAGVVPAVVLLEPVRQSVVVVVRVVAVPESVVVVIVPVCAELSV